MAATHRPLFRDMHVISMGIQEPIADEPPWPFAPRPWAKQLDRIAIRLRPPSICLQSLVETPSKVVPFLFRQRAARVGRLRCRLKSLIPPCLPHIQSPPADRVNIGGSPNLMMPDGSRPEYDVDRMCFRESCLLGKSFKHSFK